MDEHWNGFFSASKLRSDLHFRMWNSLKFTLEDWLRVWAILFLKMHWFILYVLHLSGNHLCFHFGHIWYTMVYCPLFLTFLCLDWCCDKWIMAYRGFYYSFTLMHLNRLTKFLTGCLCDCSTDYIQNTQVCIHQWNSFLLQRQCKGWFGSLILTRGWNIASVRPQFPDVS